MYKKLLVILCSGILISCSSSSGFADPKGKLEANISSIQSVGQNEITFYNTGKSPVSISEVILEDDTTTQMENIDPDKIIENAGTCKGAKLYTNQSCKLEILNQKAKTGIDTITLKTDIGDFKYDIKISTPKGDLDLSTNQINNVGQNTFTITNNRNSNIKLSDLTMSNVNTNDTGINLSACFGITLKPNDTCTFNIHAMAGQTGSDKISVNTDVGDYNYDITVNTSDNDLILNSHAIAESGNNIVYLKNMAINPVTVNYVSSSQTNTYDTIDTSQCINKTLSKNETCTITINTIDKVAGIDNLTIITDVGNYTQTINIDTTGAGLLDTDETANIDTTKQQTVRVYNKGSMPVTLKTFNVTQETTTQKMMKSVGLASNDDDSLQVNDSTCLNKMLNGGQMCEIVAKAKGNTNNKHLVNFTTNNGYMREQPIETFQKTIDTKLEIYNMQVDTESGCNEITLNAPGTHNLRIKNTGSNDMTITKLDLNNTTVGTITRDTCTSINLYAGEYCDVDFSVLANAYGTEELTIVTTQNHPNNTILFTVNEQELIYDDGTSKTNMPTNAIKEFTLKNPNNFALKINSLIFDTTSYSIVENKCDGANLAAGGTCTFKLNSNGNLGTTTIKVVSDSYPSGIQLGIQITDALSIDPKITSNKLYQSFKLTNPNGSEVTTIAIDNKSSGTFLVDGQNTNLFTDTNCAKFNGSIPKNTICEYMVMYPENSNPNSGEHIIFNTSSNGGKSSQDFVSTVTKHIETIPQSPSDGTVLQANPRVVDLCGIKTVTNTTGYASDYLNNPVFFIIKMSYSSFNSGKLPIELYSYDSRPNCVSSSGTISTTKTTQRILLGSALNNINSTYSFYQDAGENCDNGSMCYINISVDYTIGLWDTTTALAKWLVTFTIPKPASSSTITDSVAWNQVE